MEEELKQINFAFIGFGKVGRAFARMLLKRRKWLIKNFGIEWRITGIATRSHGAAIDSKGLPISRILKSGMRNFDLTRFNNGPDCDSNADFIRQCGADILFEMSVLDLSGEPSSTHIREALRAGLNVITTNKGPIATHFSKLTRLARQRDVQLLYEGTVMDGAPVFNLVKQSLPGTRLHSLRGILNSTTKYMLTQMEQGASFETSLNEAQKKGTWDSAAKLSILIQALMAGNVKPADIDRNIITEDIGRRVRSALRRERRLRMVTRAYRQGGKVVGKVELQELEIFDPLAAIRGLSNILILNTDTMQELAIIENNPSIDQTAYALFSDLVSIL
ncbi:MAG: homoserine dehydrogenase [Acidobacteriota bacterium]